MNERFSLIGPPPEWKGSDFLEHLRPGGPWAITAIVPDGATVTRTFAASETQEMAAFIRQHNSTKNVYFSLNPTRTAMSSKAKKADIASVAYLHVDADPDPGETPEQFKARLLPQIAAYHLAPTFIVDSGNGLQLLWRLGTPVAVDSAETIADIEARNRALAQAFGADPSTRNIDRVLRLPGTTNLPNKTKRAAGRVACPAALVAYNGAAVHDLSAFPAAQADKPKAKERPAAATDSKPTKRRLPAALKQMLNVTGDKPRGYASRSDLLWAFLGHALRLGYDEHDIITAVLDPAYQGCSIYEHVADNDGEDYLRRQIEKSINDPGTTDETRKQIIRVQGGSLHSDWRSTERALMNSGCPVYVRGGALVQPLWRWERASIESDRGTLIATFSKLNLARLRDIVGHHAAAFQKFDTKQNRWKPVDPPRDVIETLLEAGHWGFPSVVGIVNSPTMRPDGSLLTEPGYDAATQLWYKPAGDITLPDMPDQPTEAQARDSLQLLRDLLKGFPFVDEVDEAVAIAAIMTCVLRGAFDTSPLFFINAPEAGTGKSYLVNVISNIATGRDASALFSTPNAEEMDKRLSAAAIEARPILNLNNLTEDLESALLCQMITESTIDIRPFGKNDQTISCDCRGMTIFANGNGIRIVGDLVRRTVTCRINAEMESPEDRTFAFDPIDRVKADRGKYLSAVFTIARAYMKAGNPEVAAVNVAGFARWARFVQRPLVWLGAGDPFASKASAKALNPDREALAERLAILVRVFGVGQVFDAAAVRVKSLELTQEGGGYPKPKYPELVEAYGTRNGVTTKSVGRQMMRDIGRFAGDYCLRLASKSDKTSNTYRIDGPADGSPVGSMPKVEEPF